MCYSELIEEIEEMCSEMYSLFGSNEVLARLLDISQKLDDLIVRYYHRLAKQTNYPANSAF